MKLAITTLYRPLACRFFQQEHCLQVKFSWANFYDWNFRKEILASCEKTELATAFNWFFVSIFHFFFLRSQVSNRDTFLSDVRNKKKQFTRRFSVIFEAVFKYRLLSFPADKAQRLQERCRELGLHNADVGWVSFSLFHLPQFFFLFPSIGVTYV